jgi:Protein of unknown function (DUF3500)
MAGIERAMTTAAEGLLSALPPGGEQHACHPFTGPARTQWSYLPGPRRGIALSELGTAGRKAAYRLLATALSRATFAQAVTIMAFEEVLDLDEHGQRGRHSSGYHVAVFGSPGDDAWAWRFEGHHLSVTVTIIAGQPVVAPLFMGANPAQVRHNGQLVIAPLLREEELARALITALPPALRDLAVIAGTAPADIITTTATAAGNPLQPTGITLSRLPEHARGQVRQLLGIYLDRLAPDLADGEHRAADSKVTFAWAGGLLAGEAHYYRIQQPGLLIEYGNSQRHADHAHTVLRRPGQDFGASLLASHLAAERP